MHRILRFLSIFFVIVSVVSVYPIRSYAEPIRSERCDEDTGASCEPTFVRCVVGRTESSRCPTNLNDCKSWCASYNEAFSGELEGDGVVFENGVCECGSAAKYNICPNTHLWIWSYDGDSDQLLSHCCFEEGYEPSCTDLCHYYPEIAEENSGGGEEEGESFCPADECSVGEYSYGSTCRECTTKPANSHYVYDGGEECAWECDAGYYGSSENGDTSCSACGSGYFCTGGTSRRHCSTVVKSGSPTPSNYISLSPTLGWGDQTHATSRENCWCDWNFEDETKSYLNESKCIDGPLEPNYTHYYDCKTGYYATNPLNSGNWYQACAQCTNKPAHSHYTSYSTPSTMYAVESNCPWECDTGYVKSGNSCVAIQAYTVTLDSQGADADGTTEFYYQYQIHDPCYYYTSPTTFTSSTCMGANGYTITVPTRTGYTFGGYYTGRNGAGTQYVNSSGTCVNNIYNVAGNTTLYAKWTPKSYTCSSGKYLPANSTTCSTCEAGSYCSGGTFSFGSGDKGLTDCPSSRPFSASGAKSSSDCFQSDSAFTVTTTNMSSNTTFSFKISAKGTFTIDWGDGSVETIDRNDTYSDTYSHKYSTSGVHTIGIGGSATGYSSNTQTGAISFSGNTYVAEISGSLGAVFPTLPNNQHSQPRFYSTFYNCTNLGGTIPADLFSGIEGTPVSNMFRSMFNGCSKLTGYIPYELFGDMWGSSGDSAFYNMMSGTTNMDTVCPANMYLATVDLNPSFNKINTRAICSPCPTGSTSERGAAVGLSGCKCSANAYMDMDRESCSACPSGMVSPEGSIGAYQCVCPANTYKNGSRCNACPGEEISPAGSTSVGDCIAPEFFITTTNMSSGDTFVFKMSALGSFTIDWGDGSVETIDRHSAYTDTYEHEYTTSGVHNISMGGAATGYSTNDETAAISFRDNEFISTISGSLGAIFRTLEENQQQQPGFYKTFCDVVNLQNIPGTLFDGITGQPTMSMFDRTFDGCTGLRGSIPANLFSGLDGEPVEWLFAYTFNNCSGLTGSIPANLFSGIEGDPENYMFAGTFYGCSGLTGQIPSELFRGLNPSEPKDRIFDSTFYGCSGLSGYIPYELFRGFSGARASDDFLNTTLGASGLSTTCPAGLYQATINTIPSFNKLDNHAICAPCPSGATSSAGAVDIEQCYCQASNNYMDTSTNSCKACPSGYPNSDSGATGITQCYSNTKQRAWTGSQVNGSIPTNCYSVTEWKTCSKSSCDYVAYSNTYGTGDGIVKNGCSINNANCTKDPKTVTAKSGYRVDGVTCPACPTNYPNSNNGNTGGINACWLSTQPGKYVATTSGGQTQCTCGGYCTGGTTVYYGGTGHTTTGGRTACSTNKYNPSNGSSSSSACSTVATGYSVNSDMCGVTPNQITLNWNENNGTAISNGMCTYNSSIQFPSSSATTRSGYVLNGWTTVGDDSEEEEIIEEEDENPEEEEEEVEVIPEEEAGGEGGEGGGGSEGGSGTEELPEEEAEEPIEEEPVEEVYEQCPNGQYWNGSSCGTAQQTCSSLDGNWSGSVCMCNDGRDITLATSMLPEVEICAEEEEVVEEPIEEEVVEELPEEEVVEEVEEE